ncbi:Signal recognition particle receptor subunit alpha [Acropora cervicornis]|uniref:Signal recognition particle receptor subunit alpha n=1 Tax=Acropora cervicornis TaxID=6130 RepID=A0AAD9QSE5_ACRCE|nr:Signal recognition particle receptor subunit alpha [Acropora cervicornis]
MLDLFTIFSKGGIVLWCFQGTCQSFTLPVNELIRSVILQERGGNNSFTHGSLALKYKLDNEFELVFVVAFQKTLQLSYIDKLLTDIQLKFRDKYKDELEAGTISGYDFNDDFNRILRETESRSKIQAPAKMRTFQESKKSQKTVESLKIDKNDKIKQENSKTSKKGGAKNKAQEVIEEAESKSPEKTAGVDSKDGLTPEEIIKMNIEKMKKKNPSKSQKASVSSKSSPAPKKKGKEARKWDNAGTAQEGKTLDYSNANGNQTNGHDDEEDLETLRPMVGTMQGELKPMEYESESEDDEEEEEEEDAASTGTTAQQGAKSAGLGGGLFSFFKGLAGQKTLTLEDINPVLDKMKEHLVAKNVAADISEKLCDSVATKLEGKVLGTFSGITSTVKASLEESLVQILSPQRRIDILRDAMEAKKRGKPYSITFCGICFWLLDNGFRVMIAACDTFRAGAVEQLRTHVRHLNALHPPASGTGPPSVMLYEKAREQRIDVVLVDTAGRMQDNEPLMRALSKLIKLNNPNLVLFVGEALVGNEAVDQLKKFNQALADYSMAENPRLIDGILLTKWVQQYP